MNATGKQEALRGYLGTPNNPGVIGAEVIHWA